MSQENKGKEDRKAGCLQGTLKKTDYGPKKKSAITMLNQIGLHPRKNSSDQVTFRVSGMSFKMPFLIIFTKESRSAHNGNTGSARSGDISL